MNEQGELDRLYYEGGESTLDLTEHGVSFSSQVIAAALENIYRRKYDPDHELDGGIYHETVDILNRAAATGLSDAIQTGVKMPSNAFLTAIKSNVRVFSAFRTHRMQNDIAALMTDKEGNLRSFSAFSKLAFQYTDHKNKAWLRTEYDTAVLRAHQAADWQQFEAEKDVLPNLEWMPSTSPNPGADHQPFWGTILPIDDAFWNEHRPGDRWNCKCELRNTDKAATDRPYSTNPTDQPARGLDCNPGVNGELFSDSHPYIPNECGTCPFGDARLLALAAGRKGNCTKCNALTEATQQSQSSIERHQWMTRMQPLLQVKVEQQTDTQTLHIGFTKQGNKHLLADTFGRSSVLTKADLPMLDHLLTKSTYVSSATISKQRKDNIKRFYYFEAELHGQKVYLNVAETEVFVQGKGLKHNRFLYSITDYIK